jgi:glycosyltransferase involved in cell wall biosynthesis
VSAPGFLAPPPRAPVEPLPAPPSFSVAIAAYQAAPTIAEAVRSALDQTLPALETIVVDDGSTDDLAGALRPFGERVTLVRKPNGGVASARNAGLERAAGELVAYLDADDRFGPRRLELLAELAVRRPDLDLLATDMTFVAGGREAGRFYAENEFAVAGQRAAILRSCFVGGLPAVRASRLRAIGGFDEGLAVGSDWDCWLRLILAGSAAGLVDRPCYEYRRGGESLTASRTTSLRARVRLLEKARSNPDLRLRERPLLWRELRRRRREADAQEAREAGAAG